MKLSDTPKIFNNEVNEFKKKLGREATEEERRKIARKVYRLYLRQNVIEDYGLTENTPNEEIEEKIDFAIKFNDSKVIRKREEDYKLIHGITKDRARIALDSFLETIPERYKDASLSDFNEGATIVEHLLSGGSCLFTGSTGCGKTRLLYAVCKHLCPNYAPSEVVVDELSVLISKIHENSGASDWIDYADEKYCRQTKILAIDEYDKCKMTKSDIEIINHIVNGRYNNNLQTIVVGNGDLQKAINILGEPIVSRLTGRAEGGRYFQLNEKDRRQ